jgi:hypothetical protein
LGRKRSRRGSRRRRRRREKAREKAREKEEEREKAREKVKEKKVLVGVELFNHVKGERGRQRVHQTRPGGLRISRPGLKQFEQGGLLSCEGVARQEPLDVVLGRYNYQRRVSGGVLRGGLTHHERLVPIIRVVRAAWLGLEDAAPTGLVQPASTHAVFFRPCKRNYRYGGKNNQLVDLKTLNSTHHP